MDYWDFQQRMDKRMEKIRALGETVSVARINPQNGENTAPPFEVTEALQSKGYKYEELQAQVGHVGPADVVITTAVIAGGSGVISAAITAAVTYISKLKEGRVEITGRSGRKVVIPRGTPKEEFDFYMQKARELDAEVITIVDAPTHEP